MKAKIWNKHTWVKETNPEILKADFYNKLLKSGFKIEGFIEKSFSPFGYTALWLLSESHFALHTFPEENKTYIELSSCNKEYYDNFIKNGLQ